MANAPKNDPTVSPETFALYYFPEIPDGGGKRPDSKHERATFIQGTGGGNSQRLDPGKRNQESPQVQAALDDAFRRGLEQGRAEMAATHQETIDCAASSMKSALAELVSIHRQDLACKEKETVRLALAIAQRIIGGERNHEEVIRHTVKAALQRVADPRQLTIRLNPEDIEVVTRMEAELLPEDDADTALQLQPDETIGRGGCIIETRLGDVDARIEQQIGIVESILSAELNDSGSNG